MSFHRILLHTHTQIVVQLFEITTVIEVTGPPKRFIAKPLCTHYKIQVDNVFSFTMNAAVTDF